MKFNMYGRTPRIKTPKWAKILLAICYAAFVALFFVSGVVMSIELRSIYPLLIMVAAVSAFAFLFIDIFYRINKSYVEISDETIKITEYYFFRKREKTVLFCDIKRVKWRAGGRGLLPQLVFKNHKNKNLFHLDYVPEVISYFENRGFEIEI